MRNLTDAQKKFQLIKFKVLENDLQEIFESLSNLDFEIILIKGWAAALSYPARSERQFTDFDLMVEPARYASALKALKTIPKGYLVDLHNGARRHDTQSFRDLYAHSQTAVCGRTIIRIPRPEDHLRILCVHWLTDGGAYKERLWDIFYAVANRPADFDWERLLNVVSPTRRLWIVYTIGLAHKYLGLDLENTPIAAEAKKIPLWICRTIEREWASETKLRPLPNPLRNFREFIKQTGRRLPPNPIHATVQSGGEFDEGWRAVYQLRNIVERSQESLARELRKFLEK